MGTLHSNRGAGLLIIILILMGISLTASVLTVSVRLAWDEQATAETQKRLRDIAEAISSTNFQSGARRARHYEQDVGALPTALDDLLTKPAAVSACAMSATTSALSGWCGPYYTGTFSGESLWVDGWGNTLTLSAASRHVRSKGPNGTDNSGGADDIVQPF
jgi:hypothetical protein